MIDTSRPFTIQKAEIDHAVEALLTEAKGRKLTEDEQQALDAYALKLGGIEKRLQYDTSQKAFMEALNEAVGGRPNGDPNNRIVLARGHEMKSAGQEFVESLAGKWLVEQKGERVG